MTIFKDKPFRPELDLPLYQQLYASLQMAILSGELRSGIKLPSTRALADEINLSRNTVLNAYEQLIAEGYLECIQGSGTYVARVLPDLPLTMIGRVKVDVSLTQPHQPHIARGVRRQMAAAPQFASLLPTGIELPRPFRFGAPALDAFPSQLWSRLITRNARWFSGGVATYQEAAGYRPLREAIAAHVAISRQVHCTPDQIIIVAGAQGAFNLTAQVLLDEGDSIWMEDPGYFGARGAFLGAGADVIPVPVDQEGIDVEAGIARAPAARLAYVTPSHQFPLGVTMSLTRRLALLDWAKRADAYILEDDYDSEYRFGGRPLAALQSIDNAERVIYIGSFSKVLFPSLRIGYLILPQLLVEPFLVARGFIDSHTPLLEQAVLTDFLVEGHFQRHLRRMRILYAERRSAFIEAASALPLEIQSADTGIYCIGWLPDGIDELSLVRTAHASDLFLWPISSLCVEPLKRKGLVFGYGAYNPQEIKDGIQRLAGIMNSI